MTGPKPFLRLGCGSSDDTRTPTPPGCNSFCLNAAVVPLPVLRREEGWRVCLCAFNLRQDERGNWVARQFGGLVSFFIFFFSFFFPPPQQQQQPAAALPVSGCHTGRHDATRRLHREAEGEDRWREALPPPLVCFAPAGSANCHLAVKRYLAAFFIFFLTPSRG